jgi:CRISPR/Cas system-associated exonuclease Cas4 (RecB family)
MQLTKTDFIQYLNCPKSLWLLKNKPEDFPKGEFSLFLEKLIKEGYEVEEYAQQLFPNAVNLPDFGSAELTKQEIEKGNTTFFQATFLTEKGVFARIDILEKKEDGTWHIYEVKSSTSIKKDRKHNHLKDACFQKHAMLESGYKVSQVSIIHLNKEYIKQGEINPNELLEIEDVTEQINDIYSGVVNQINSAVNYINIETISLNTCTCREITRSNHCDSFKYFNPDIPDYSIYEIGRISAKKVVELIDLDILAITDIPSDYKLNEKQQLQVESVRQNQPIIDHKEIENKLSALKFPLHFIDYETYASAVPRIDGIRPHQHIPFQVSIHTMQKDGSIQHFEYLAYELELPIKLNEFMESSTGKTGTFISWHASFEMSRNKDMIKMLPQHENYLTHMNSNMFDLEDVFKIDYVDYRFHGSTSIKKVLPVLLPDLSYNDLEVQNGTMALDVWGRMVLDDNFDEDKVKVRKNLLTYCELDTLAMVELYRELKKHSN